MLILAVHFIYHKSFSQHKQ